MASRSNKSGKALKSYPKPAHRKVYTPEQKVSKPRAEYSIGKKKQYGNLGQDTYGMSREEARKHLEKKRKKKN